MSTPIPTTARKAGRVLIHRSGNDRIYAITKWIERDDGALLPLEKYDITDDFDRLSDGLPPGPDDVDLALVEKSIIDELMLGRVTKRTAKYRARMIIERFHANRWRVKK